MRTWAKMHGKSVRQRNVRQDNTMDRAGTLPLNLNETETVLKPVNLNPLIGVERVPTYYIVTQCTCILVSILMQNRLDI